MKNERAACEDNVVPLFAGMPEHDPAPAPPISRIKIRLSSVEGTRKTLNRIEQACTVGLLALDQAPTYGDAAALRVVGQVFAVLSALLETTEPLAT